MSEKLLRIRLDELKIVRIFCPHPPCNGVLEFSLDKLKDIQNANGSCPLCASRFHLDNAMLKSFAASVSLITGKDGFKVEFVIPQTDVVV